jgi:class 3 adenylate cyclase
MQLFMDRHDVPGATAEDVAQAHVSDLALAGKHGVQFLSYWFDADHGGVFCFARAPSRESLEAVHNESHGIVPNEIISVSEDDVLRFLGKVHDPVDHTQLTSPFRAILFTDLEGSTALAESLETSAFMSLLTEHDVIIRRALFGSRGREVKHTGDGIMASFDDIPNALRCALEIQAGFRARVDEGKQPECRVRIGMAAGEPVDHNDDIFGSTVNLASRICDVADPEEIFVSDVVYDLGLRSGFAFADVDPRTLKGFSGPVRIFRLLGRSEEALDRRGTESFLSPGLAGQGIVARARRLLRRRPSES